MASEAERVRPAVERGGAFGYVKKYPQGYETSRTRTMSGFERRLLLGGRGVRGRGRTAPRWSPAAAAAAWRSLLQASAEAGLAGKHKKFLQQLLADEEAWDRMQRSLKRECSAVQLSVAVAVLSFYRDHA